MPHYPAEAEQIKLDYAAGMETSGEIRSIIAADLEIWQEALILALQEIKKGSRSRRGLSCAEGSGLPGIMEAIASPKLVESGLFAVVPEVKLLRPEDVFGIADPKQFLSEVQDVTPKSIAFQASLIEGRGSTILGGVQQG